MKMEATSMSFYNKSDGEEFRNEKTFVGCDTFVTALLRCGASLEFIAKSTATKPKAANRLFFFEIDAIIKQEDMDKGAFVSFSSVFNLVQSESAKSLYACKKSILTSFLEYKKMISTGYEKEVVLENFYRKYSKEILEVADRFQQNDFNQFLKSADDKSDHKHDSKNVSKAKDSYSDSIDKPVTKELVAEEVVVDIDSMDETERSKALVAEAEKIGAIEDPNKLNELLRKYNFHEYIESNSKNDLEIQDNLESFINKRFKIGAEKNKKQKLEKLEELAQEYDHADFASMINTAEGAAETSMLRHFIAEIKICSFVKAGLEILKNGDNKEKLQKFIEKYEKGMDPYDGVMKKIVTPDQDDMWMMLYTKNTLNNFIKARLEIAKTGNEKGKLEKLAKDYQYCFPTMLHVASPGQTKVIKKLMEDNNLPIPENIKVIDSEKKSALIVRLENEFEKGEFIEHWKEIEKGSYLHSIKFGLLKEDYFHKVKCLFSEDELKDFSSYKQTSSGNQIRGNQYDNGVEPEYKVDNLGENYDDNYYDYT